MITSSFTGNKTIHILLLIVLLGVVISCKTEKEPITSLNGTWSSIGSGWIMDIQDSTTYSMYDITQISCLPNRKASLKELKDALTLEEDTLLLKKGALAYKFIRTDKLPENCIEATEEQKNDPLYNFEVFAQTVETYYAYFDLNQIVWENLYKQQRAKLNPDSSPAELYLVIEETLELLNDNHAYLEAPDEVYEAIEQMNAAPTNEEEVDTLREYGDLEVAGLVAKSYLMEDMTKDAWQIQWGKMEDNTGFLQVKLMWLYAKLDIPKELIEELGYIDAYVKTFHQMNEGAYIDMEVQAARKIMERAMADLKGTDRIIVDIRFNGGGQDAVSLEILKYFNDERRVIAKEKLKYGATFSPTQSIYLEASEEPFLKPVYVLTSSQTGSAAEVFSIATIALPHVKRIGSRTQGATSTALEKKLPNGWDFAISDEIYEDINGICHENQGVPPNYEIEYSRERQPFFRKVAADLDQDKKQVLNAIDELEK